MFAETLWCLKTLECIRFLSVQDLETSLKDGRISENAINF